MPHRWGLWFLALLLSACLPQSRTRSSRPAPAIPEELEVAAPALRAAGEAIHTVQLYRTGDEIAPPVLVLQGGETLTLEFDLLASGGRPLSVYFYHVNRAWQPDLVPTEYMAGDNRDDLLAYTRSRHTTLPYVHYRYRFPNDRIDFRYSGNYILRVTEQGDEEAVLVERVFFVSEEQAETRFSVSPVFLGGGWPSHQPSIEFIPPADLQGQIFDFTACFARLPELEQLYCTTRPPYVHPPVLSFTLQPTSAFPPEPPYRLLDLRLLRPGGDIERVDLSRRPPVVLLAPDPAGAGNILHRLELNGQPLIDAAVRDVADPDLMAEYVRTRFRLEPPEGRYLGDPIIVVGSFLSWSASDAGRLTWNAATGFYEGELLVKQGTYEYGYRGPALDRYRREQGIIGTRTPFMAFVYYFEPQRQTDRLLAVRMALP